MRCPKHIREDLVPQKTKYGVRYACPILNCTVVCWDGSTSTPADYETRQARITAHKVFDKIWKSGIMSRKEAYKKLAKYLGLTKKKTHIGTFTFRQCGYTIDFCTALIAAPEVK